MNERNQSVDVLRGIAILMVILGHTISGCTDAYAETSVYNVIWSLQMPLFFILSGYVNRYGNTICDGRMLGRFVAKRTAAYIIPWLVWTFLVRGLVFGASSYLNVKYLLWHMDSGYWFLMSLWMIVLAFGLSQFLASKFVKEADRPILHLAASVTLFALCGVILLVVGVVVGLSFLGIKLTVYYMPFYALGVLFGKLQKSTSLERLIRVTEIAVLISGLVYFALITRFELFAMGESVPEIGIRVLVSLSGCVVLCGTVGLSLNMKRENACLQWVGKHSLELYLIHHLFLFEITPKIKPMAASVAGFGMCVLNYAITVACAVLAVRLLNQNRMLRKVLFWKKS